MCRLPARLAKDATEVGGVTSAFYNSGMYLLRACLILPLLLLGSCGSYDPPIQGDHSTDKYKSDLQACRRSSHHAVYLQNAAGPGTWIISPIIGPPKVRAGIRSCMQDKGYVLTRHE